MMSPVCEIEKIKSVNRKRGLDKENKEIAARGGRGKEKNK